MAGEGKSGATALGMLPFLGTGVAGDSDTLVLLGGNTYGGGEAGLHDKGFDLNREAMPDYWGYRDDLSRETMGRLADMEPVTGPGAPMTAIRVFDADALPGGKPSAEAGGWTEYAGRNIDLDGRGEGRNFEGMDRMGDKAEPQDSWGFDLCRAAPAGCYTGGTLNYWSLDGKDYYRRPVFGPGPVYAWRMQTEAWLNGLFPSLPAPPVKPREPKIPWPADARAIARSLLRTEHLTGIQNGLRIESEHQSFDPRWNELTFRGRTSALISADGWLIESADDNSQTTLAWADARERGMIGMAFLLGRVRTAKPADLAEPPLGLGVGVLAPLNLSYPNYSVEVKPAGQDRTLLVLKAPWSPNDEQRILVDTARHVVLKTENAVRGKVTSTTTFDDFVEVAGAWYAGRIESMNAEGGRSGPITHKFIVLAPGDFARQWKQRLAVLDRVQLLREPLPTLAEAKKAAAAGKAGFEDQMVLLLHFQATQQWDRVMNHFEAAEKISGKPGMRWVRTALLQIARHAEDAKQRYFKEAAALAAKRGLSQFSSDENGTVPLKIATGDDLFLAEYIVRNARQVLQADEMLRLLDALRPVYQRQPAHRHAMKTWTELRIGLLEQTGQSGEVLKLRGQVARDYPHDYILQQQYARWLAGAGEYKAAYAWLDRVLAAESRWRPNEEEYLRICYADLLREQGRYDDVGEYLGACVKRNPPSQQVYAQYLGALVWTGREKQADALVAQWIKDGQRPDDLPPDVDARLRAAVAQALGQGYNCWTNRIDEPWFRPLADAAIYFARHPSASSVADEIMNQYHFQQSDECRRVRKEAVRHVALRNRQVADRTNPAADRLDLAERSGRGEGGLEADRRRAATPLGRRARLAR